MDWQKLGSQIVFDKFMKIEEQTYKLPNGVTKQFYIKLTRPTVCVLPITKDGKVITVKQFRPGPQVFLNELPGGYIDEGENRDQAAARELLEETGYKGNLQFVTMCLDDAYTPMDRACYVATNCQKVADQDLDDGESITVELLDLPDFIVQVRSGRGTDIEVALLGLDKLGLLK